MTPIQIALVQSSWRRLRPAAADVAALFYGRLFELDPALKPLFRNDLVAQGRKLTTALEFVVDGLAQIQPRLPVLQELARRHVGYGVQERDYDTVGAALLWTLKSGLGDEASEELLAAWAQAYGLVAGAMKQAAWPATAGAREWAVQAG